MTEQHLGVDRSTPDHRSMLEDTAAAVMLPNLAPMVRKLAEDEPIELVWTNELGGTTYRVGHRYLKWAPAGSGLELQPEADRLAWAEPFHPVPRVLDVGADQSGSWLLTAALPGENAATSRWRGCPEVAVPALGRGLRAFHEALPVESCPFRWQDDEWLPVLSERAAAGAVEPARWHSEHRGMSVADALARAADPPPIDRLVVCHGDACAPNTLLSEDGEWTAHVDLRWLGVADRWADLAVATWSTVWNYGPGWEEPLLAAYGIDPDPDRTAYYRLLWDLGP